MKRNSWRVSWWYTCIFLIAELAIAAEDDVLEIRYVAVGVSEYATPNEPGWSGMPSVSGANTSARDVARRLSDFGGRGVTLGSRADRFITTDDINSAVERVLMDSQGAQTLFVFYFAGHGISEGIAWNQFLIPGDFAYESQDALEIDTLASRALHTATLVDAIKQYEVPFLLLIDACYEGELEDFQNAVLSETATQSLIDVASILKAINEFRDDYPVLLSTEPGTLTKTVAHPFEPDSPFSIGPLARRLLLALDPTKPSISFQELVNTLRSPALDGLTRPAVSRVNNVPHLGVLNPVSVALHLQEREGSAVGATLEESLNWETASEFVPKAGSFRLAGNAGNFVSGDKDNQFESTNHVFEVEQFAPNHIQLWIDDGDWLVELAQLGQSQFVPGNDYSVSSNDGEEDTVLLDISGDGRGCNHTSGRLTIKSVQYRGDELAAIETMFRYRCDDDTTFAEGHLELRPIEN